MNIGAIYRKSSYLYIGLVAAIPAAIYILNHNFFYINFYSPPWFDPYIYLSLFRNASEQMHHTDYYPATRIGYILLGSPFHYLLPPVPANDVFKLTLSTLTVIFFYNAVQSFVDRSVAILSTILLATYPYFMASMGWDYVEAGVIFYQTILYWMIARAILRSENLGTELLIGFIYALLLGCNLYTAALAPWSLLLYFAILWYRGRPPKVLLVSFVRICVGGIAGLIFLSVLSGLLGGSYWFLSTQITMALSLRSDPSWSFSSWSHLIPAALWSVVPLVLGIVGAIWLMAGAVIRPLRGTVFAQFFIAHYVLSVIVFVATTVATSPILLFWFYANLLIVPAFMVVGFLLDALITGRISSYRVISIGLISATLLVALYAFKVGGALQKALSIPYGAPSSMDGALLTIIIMLIFALAAKFRSAILVGVALCLTAYFYLTMMTSAQLNHTIQTDRRHGYLATLTASDLIEDWGRSGDVYVWINRAERPHGSLFHGIWINSLLTRKVVDTEQSTRFPDLPPTRFELGKRVVILTSSIDWREKANESLHRYGLVLSVAEEQTIEFGNIKFQLIKGIISAS
jgi:hypothetical protein